MQTTKNDYTHLTMVLDRSGSMESVRTDTIGGFNTFLTEQQAQPGQATLTLIQFDDHYEKWFDFSPLASVPRLTMETFVPRGSTALLDALGRAIDETGQRLSLIPDGQKPAKVLVVVLTDGMENASSTFTWGDVQAKITHQREKYGWEFVFIGANQDAIATGAQVGIQASHAITYAPTALGQADVMRKMSKNVARKRQEAERGIDIMEQSEFFTQEDRDTLPDMPKQ